MPDEEDLIERTLKSNPRGMTISSIARRIDSNRNTVSKYLDIMLAEGRVEMRQIGSAKLYSLSSRVPIASLIDASSDIIAVFDRNLSAVQCNSGFSNLIGVKKRELVGMSIGSSPLANTEIEQKMWEALRGTHCIFESAVGTEQESRCLSVTLFPINLADGTNGVCMIAADTTEKRKMSNALSDSETKYRTLVNAMSDMIFVLDERNTVVEAHISKYNTFPIPRDYFVGKHVSDVTPQDVTDIFLRLAEEVRNSVEPRTVDFPLNVDGADFWFTAVLTLHEDNESVVILVRDITKRRQAELKLAERDETLRLVFANAGIGMAIVDPNDKFIDVNQTYQELLGYSREELVGRSWVDFTHPDDVETEHNLFNEMIRQGKDKFTYEKRCTRRDKSSILVDMTVTVVRNSENKPQFTVAMVRDITGQYGTRTKPTECEKKIRERLIDTPFLINIVDSQGRHIHTDRTVKSCWICLE